MNYIEQKAQHCARRFCKALFKHGGNAHQAYLATFAKAGNKAETHRARASEMLRSPRVMEEMAKLAEEYQTQGREIPPKIARRLKAI